MLVWTSVTAGFEDCLLDWIVSLRKTARYKGRVMIINYGINKSFKSFVEKYNVEFIDIPLEGKHVPESIVEDIQSLEERNEVRSLYDSSYVSKTDLGAIKRDLAVNFRYMDIVDILKKEDPNELVAHFDVDIWFQDPIDGLFSKIKDREGLSFSTQLYMNDLNRKYRKKCVTRIPPLIENRQESIKVQEMFYSTVDELGGHINGGFFAGKAGVIVERFKPFRDKIEKGEWPNLRGANQLWINHSYNPATDYADCNPYNTMPFHNSDGNVKYIKGLWYYGDEVAKGIHTMDYKILNYKVNVFSTMWEELNRGK